MFNFLKIFSKTECYHSKFIVEVMRCEKCAARVISAVSQLTGVLKVEVFIEKDLVNVYSDYEMELSVIEAVISDCGYKIKSSQNLGSVMVRI